MSDKKNEEDVSQINSSYQHIFDTFNALNESLCLFKTQLCNLQHQVKCIEKDVKKELKSIKKSTKTKVKSKKPPSGFAKPTKVTKELCVFMNRPDGTEIARTEVTKFLVQYIKTNGLQEQNGETKNKIVPDEKLQSLLCLNTNEANDLTFFTIQKYMNKHFISNKNTSTPS
jgi:chromatin remodeling complex protein RSC6